MDYSEDFQDSEAWLSEKIFSQLKDFNDTTNNSVIAHSENKLSLSLLESSSSSTRLSPTNPIDLSVQNKTFIDLHNSNTTKPSIDNFETLTDFKSLNLNYDQQNIQSPCLLNISLNSGHSNLMCNVNNNNQQTSSGILNLKQELLEAQQHQHNRDLLSEQSIKIDEEHNQPEQQHINYKTSQYEYFNDLYNENNNHNINTHSVNESSEIYHNENDDQEQTQVLLIQDENVENYYEMMMKLPESCNKDNIVLIEEEDADNKDSISFVPYTQFIKCMNCDQIFEYFAFTQHICEYDSKKKYILSEEEIKQRNVTALKKLLDEDKKYFSVEPACLRQLRENNAKIRKFLKDGLKYDIENPEGAASNRKTDGANECTLCERKFVHASGLARHMEKHALDLIPSTTNAACFENRNRLKVMVKCATCGRVFFTAKNGLDHFNDNHQIVNGIKQSSEQSSVDKIKVEALQNENVTEEFVNTAIAYLNKKSEENCPVPNVKNDNDYLKVIILSSILQCEFCDFVFTDVSNLLKHSSTHDPSRGFQCNSCEINVGTSKEIFLHYQAECVFSRELLRNNHNLQRLFVCNVCENKFSTLEQLLDHRYSSLHLFPRLNKTLNVLQIGCEYCGSMFESATDILKHHEEKHFKKILNNSYAKRDLNTPKPRQYLCDVCGKSYTQSSHLWQHLRFHRGVKPFACTEPDCNRKFTIRPDLNDHIRKCHTGERPYHCLICGKRFLTGSVFYQHRLIHRGERRYGCEECGKRFYRADALKNHLRIHTGEKPYSCLYCSKNFRQRGDRDKHIRARHANLDENAKNILTALKNGTIPPTKVIPPPQRPQTFPTTANTNDVVFVGNVPFPASMFKPVVMDIEGQDK